MNNSTRTARRPPLHVRIARFVLRTHWKTVTERMAEILFSTTQRVGALEGQSKELEGLHEQMAECQRRQAASETRVQKALAGQEQAHHELIQQIQGGVEHQVEVLLQREFALRFPPDPLIHKLRIVQAALGYDHLALADRFGVVEDTVRLWLSGQKLPGSHHRALIAELVYHNPRPRVDQLAGTASLECSMDPLLLKLQAHLLNQDVVDRDVAAAIGVHVRTLYKWRSGDRLPDANSRARIAVVLYGLPRTQLTDAHIEGLVALPPKAVEA